MSRQLSLTLILVLTFAFAVAGLGLLIDAQVRTSAQQSNVRRKLQSGATVTIDSSELLNPIRVSTSIHAFLMALSSLSLLAIYMPRYSSPKAFLVLALSLGLTSVWLLSTTIAVTVVFASGAAHISATANGVPITDTILSDNARRLGLVPVYKNNSYLNGPAVIPWFTWLFSALACAFMMFNWVLASQEEVGEQGLSGRKGDAKKDEQSRI